MPFVTSPGSPSVTTWVALGMLQGHAALNGVRLQSAPGLAQGGRTQDTSATPFPYTDPSPTKSLDSYFYSPTFLPEDSRGFDCASLF